MFWRISVACDVNHQSTIMYQETLLDFDPTDPLYLIGCRFSVLNAYLFVSCLQYLLAVYFLSFTILQILILENYTSSVSLRDYFLKTSINPEDEKNSFDPLLWTRQLYPSVYARLIITIITLLVIKSALIGLYRNKPLLIKMHMRWSIVYSIVLAGYVATLTWYTVNTSNYFTFCLVGLSLLVALFVNASAINVASICYTFLDTRNK